MWKRFASRFYTTTTAFTLAVVGGLALLTYSQTGYLITEILWSALAILLVTNPDFYHKEMPKAKKAYSIHRERQNAKHQEKMR